MTKIDVLVAEIGSTTTVVNAFSGIHEDGITPIFVAQGQAPTSVDEGDVGIGLNQAIETIEAQIGRQNLKESEVFATSSAAGGLKMTVHGLVYDMTVKAAREAALGAGANIHLVTAGNLTRFDLKKVNKVKPNIILIAGGVDYGEKNTALNNAYEIAELRLNIPVIYAGNCVNHDAVKEIFEECGQSNYLHITENVYPKIDTLNVEPTRQIIQDVFEQHIIHAPGMNKVKETVDQNIIPTPGSVMVAAKLLEEEIGDLIVFDVGGATTDLHSVTTGSEEINKILVNPEPKAKRTVEGDLGVYINRHNIIDMIGKDAITRDLEITEEQLESLLKNFKPIPETELEKRMVERLTKEALSIALNRHSGVFRSLYGSSGRMKVAEGKDLTNVDYVIGTGGALTRLPNRIGMLNTLLRIQDDTKLIPSKNTKILIDQDYIMASLGVLSLKYPEKALELLKNSLGL
ncbi:GlmL-related ornithine degradation protein [Haloplasma contractile]|uniref:Methylaspartate mutase protein n=1 Tax=Haloplasma contractile SSD-17B TaxID=1033810 RepID=U2FK51_9MOLU|nr:GlmL-related ornithine degradation protein [Haloplasma contractile]ERJ11609.1 methylaspartate mutase protein [Haloplasma contractile SSD-17B]